MATRPPRASVRPTGVVAFLLTDIEGSTRLWQRHPQVMRETIRRHDAILTETIRAQGGRVLNDHGEGDSFFAVFPRATQALAAARDIQRALHAEPWPEATPVKVRMAVNAGEAVGDFRGMAANRAGRIRSLSRGGQVLVSQTAESLARDELPEGVQLTSFGVHALRDVDSTERVYEAVIAGLPRVPAPAAAAPRRWPSPWLALVPAAAAAAVLAAVVLLHHGAAPPKTGGAASTRPPALSHLKIRTVAGNGTADYLPAARATDAELNHPTALAIGPDGGLYIADTGNDRIRELKRDGTLVDVAGGGDQVQAAGQPALSIKLDRPAGLAFDPQGNLYIADSGANRILKMDTSQRVTLVAGSGAAGNSGDQGLAVDATFLQPTGLAPASYTNCSNPGSQVLCVFVGDSGNGRVRRIDTALGVVAGDVGEIAGPAGMTAAPLGVLIAGGGTNRVELLNLSDDRLLPVAGTGAAGNAGDGGPALKALLNDPRGVGVDRFDRIYIADTGNNVVRVVDYASGIITTIAGSGTEDMSGDGGPALAAALAAPAGIAVTADGLIYIADTGNNRIRELTP